MAREIEQLTGHVILCGYGRMGQNLADGLLMQSEQVVVIDKDAERVAEAIAHDLLCVQGDATEDEYLASVGLERAKTIVTSLPSDAANVFITLTARDLNSNIQIIARASQQNTEKKLRQAGADKVVMPTLIGARQMVRMITRPSTADLMELVTESNFKDLELDELKIPGTNSLVGMTVAETEAHSRHRLLIVAIKTANNEMRFNPDAAYQVQAEDILMLMGHDCDIQSFRQVYGVLDESKP